MRVCKHSHLCSNLFLQEWDENLEYLAQYRAASCTFQDDQQQSVGVVGFDYVGENDAAVYSAGYNTAVNYTQVIGQQWFTEKRFFSYYSAACRDEDGNVEDNGEFTTCGRYTQVSGILEPSNLVVTYYFSYSWCGQEAML